jgi:hypothetical protein
MSSMNRPRAWARTGMLFAATMMVINGVFQLFEGISGVAKDDIYVGPPGYVVKFNTTTWGWIHIILGVAVALTGFALFSGADWARGIAMVLVAFQAISNFFFIPYYPLWALVIIALDIFVLWALATAPARRDEFRE